MSRYVLCALTKNRITSTCFDNLLVIWVSQCSAFDIENVRNAFNKRKLRNDILVSFPPLTGILTFPYRNFPHSIAKKHISLIFLCALIFFLWFFNKTLEHFLWDSSRLWKKSITFHSGWWKPSSYSSSFVRLKIGSWTW